MKKKKEKKRVRIKIIPLLVIIVFLLVSIFSIRFFLNLKTHNIFISGNEILSDQDIIDLAGLEDYPKYYKYTTKKIKKKIEENTFIEEAKVSREFFHTYNIKVKENKIILYDYASGMYILSNGEKVGMNKKINGVPTLLNYVTDDVYDKFIKKINSIDKDILLQISEIKYEPSTYDSTRFFFTMNDGNYVYINISNFKSINRYDDIYPNFDGHIGILYLDSGYGEASEYKIIK